MLLYLLITKGNTGTLQWWNLEDITVTKWPKLMSPIVRYSDIMYLLIERYEK